MNGRILIVENEARWQERLEEALLVKGYEVSLAGSLEEARELLYRIKPDVITLDMELRAYRMQGWTLLDELEVMPNSPEVIIVSGEIDRQDIQRLWRGYDIFDLILKTNYGTGGYFIQAVRDAVETKRRMDAEEDVTEAPVEPIAISEANAPCPLTEKEKEVLREVARGKSNKEIAQALKVSTNTIKKHLAHISEKLETTGRINWVNKARELGCIPSEK